MKRGDKVRIQGTHSWGFGIVEEVRTPEQLPYLGGHAPGVAQVSAILKEGSIEHVALISFQDGRVRKVFAALERAGQWYDLQGQPLTITSQDSRFEMSKGDTAV